MKETSTARNGEMAEQVTGVRAMTLGESIRGLRTAQGMSLRELASRARVSRTYLWNIELDRKSPSRAVLARLSRCLCVSSQELRKRDALAAVSELKAMLGQDRRLYLAFLDMVSELRAGKVQFSSMEKQLLAGGRT